MAAKYKEGKTDEFMPPLIFAYAGEQRVRDDDVVLFFNFRAYRARQLSQAFLFEKFDGFDRGIWPRVHFVTLTQYDVTYPSPHIFAPENLVHILGEVASAAGKTQLRIAETEKYAHVTFFMNGGRETQYPGEDRILVPSPKPPRSNLRPPRPQWQQPPWMRRPHCRRNGRRRQASRKRLFVEVIRIDYPPRIRG